MMAFDAPKQVVEFFDALADRYDQAVFRFYPFSADAIVPLLRTAPGQKILDVGTGTGAAAIALAQTMRHQGRVIAIDLSEVMLAKAMENTGKMALSNVDFFAMDAQSLEFKSDYFDHVVSAFSLYYMPDMLTALQGWKRVTKPGGKILCTGLACDVFGALLDDLRVALPQFTTVDARPLLASERLCSSEQWLKLMEQAQLQRTAMQVGQFGYHLSGPEQWWDVLWGSDVGRILQSLDPLVLAQLKTYHLGQVAKRIKPEGLWLDVQVVFCMGEV
ncbi:MAG: class I SAM-dependent methyltransferase [Gammaproteobacteria bacterium]|nr:class I SAM-dependent methyltransferase [Gammaproteobacteria bacterium]MDH5802863.1 class I SAM-dependent methyltransferase [Gammaproteobacteria bacterium]